jgi:hypothetical protein
MRTVTERKNAIKEPKALYVPMWAMLLMGTKLMAENPTAVVKLVSMHGAPTR